jgi:hypothetical protein
VVRPREPHHFEGEGFRAEVPHVPKREGQIDLPDEEVPPSRVRPRGMVQSTASVGPRDAHVVKRRRIEHVDPTSPIHQDLVDPFGFE